MDRHTYRFLKDILDDEQQNQLQAYLIMQGLVEFDVELKDWRVK